MKSTNHNDTNMAHQKITQGSIAIPDMTTNDSKNNDGNNNTNANYNNKKINTYILQYGGNHNDTNMVWIDNN